MRNDETGCRPLPGSETQPARRHQIEFIEKADNHAEAAAFQAFLDRVQRIARTRRLDDEQTRRIETQTEKAC